MKLLLLGDLYYDYDYIAEDYKKICSYVCHKGYQTIVNLESSLSDAGKPIKKRGPHLCSSDLAMDVLRGINVAAVTLANNHTMDYGGEGLLKSIKQLDKAEIKHLGAGENVLEAEEPIIFRDISSNSQDIILMNCGWDVEETVYTAKNTAGCAPLDRKKVVERIKATRLQNKNSKLILFAHWGFEYNTLPMPLDIRFAHQCIDVGCDLIIGHHPHVIQPKEIYKGKEIYYSLGNFYFGSRRDTFNKIFPYEDDQYFASIGVGVVLDTDSWKTEQIKIKYDFDSKTSDISSWDLFPVLKEQEYTDRNYIKRIKKHAMNINPILTGNEVSDCIKILLLNFEYKIYSIIKPLRMIIRKSNG